MKDSESTFCLVDPDHSQEWLNGIEKRGVGIIGITKTSTALTRWGLTFNLRGCISAKTRSMVRVGHDDQMIHK